jgi:cytoskeleton protein RodZ
MSEPDVAAGAISPPLTAGAILRSARERAGLTLEAIAQQLKLAPRQVEALETDDYARLPGRTFVRGFLRNYARCVGVDPDAVLELLPDSDHPATLERPTLQPTPRAMGELPSPAPAQRTWSRIAIPLALLAIVGVAAVYEFTRQQAESRRTAAEAATRHGSPPASTSLQNPLVETEKSPPSSTDPGTAATTPAATLTAEPATPATTTSASPALTLPVSPVPVANAPAGSTAPAAAPTPVAPATEDVSAVVFTFRGTSWIEVKDHKGSVVLAVTGNRGTTQTASGSPPFDIVIGNAPEVGVMFHGEPVDLSRYTRQNVARLTLK